MTAAGPDDTGDHLDLDARFAAIVEGLTDVTWSHTPTELDDAVGEATPAPTTLRTDADPSSAREQRKALRRIERAEEVADFMADRELSQVENSADNDHFVPPEPPPLPRLRRRTVTALLFTALGIMAMAWPQLFQIAPDAVLVLGLILLCTGLGLLVSLLRSRTADPEDGTGWDDGARL